MRRSVTLALVLAVLGGSCTSGDGVTAGERGRLVVWDDAAIAIAEDGEPIAVDSTGTVSQVTPGPDGGLVWTRVVRDPPSAAAVVDGERRSRIDTPTVPFFYEWSPTGERVAFLGNAPSGTALIFGLIDVEAGDLTTFQTPPPFFFDWSPDGETLIAHVGGTLLRVIDAETGDARNLAEQTGTFPAPAWTDRGIVVATAIGPTVSTSRVLVGYQGGASEIVLIDPTDESRTMLAAVEEPVRFFAGRDALALALGIAGNQRIDVIGWDGEPRTTLGRGTIDLVQWSPDGSILLWTERDSEGTLTPMTWSDGVTTDHPPFRPSATFAGAYLPFWDQYDRTISLWATDSSAFTLPTDEGVVVRELDGGSSIYADWDMAAWAAGRPDD